MDNIGSLKINGNAEFKIVWNRLKYSRGASFDSDSQFSENLQDFLKSCNFSFIAQTNSIKNKLQIVRKLFYSRSKYCTKELFNSLCPTILDNFTRRLPSKSRIMKKSKQNNSS